MTQRVQNWPTLTLLNQLDQIKPNLTIFDPIWLILIYFDLVSPICEIQSHSEPFWNILTQYDLIRHNLTYLHPFDPKNLNFSHQTKFDIFWPFLTQIDQIGHKLSHLYPFPPIISTLTQAVQNWLTLTNFDVLIQFDPIRPNLTKSDIIWPTYTLLPQ